MTDVEVARPEVARINLRDLIVDQEFNLREKYREISELAASIAKDGQITPISVRKRDDGKFELLTGFRRVKALKKLKKDTVIAQVADVGLTKKDARWLNFLENEHREDLTAVERAAIFANMMDEHGMSAKDIVTRYGASEDGKSKVSVSQINNLVRAFRKLVPMALKAWGSGQLSNEAAFKVASYTEAEQKDIWPKFKGRSGKALRELIAELEASTGEDGEGAGRAESEDGRSNPKPSKKAIEQAIVWANFKKLPDVANALEWVLGQRKVLKTSKASMTNKGIAEANAAVEG